MYATQPLNCPRTDLIEPFEKRLTTYTRRVNECLDAALPPASREPQRLHAAMRYAAMSGGKRIRPLLVYAAGESLGVATALLDAPAVAIELIHAFSLVHDDLPAMDDDDLRRGQPTVHIHFDEATAILAADALQPLAFSVLASIDGVSAKVRNQLVQLVAAACGSIGMTGGQAIDLAAEGESLSVIELETMYAMKTGALIHASILAAGLLCDTLATNERAALDRFAHSIGIAFQIKDDILDVEGDTDVIGKPAGSDERLSKATYPALFGIDSARRRCDELLASALNELQIIGSTTTSLQWLARFIVERGR